MKVWVITGWDSVCGTWDIRVFKTAENARLAYYKQIVEIQESINVNGGDGNIEIEDNTHCFYNIGSTINGYFDIDCVSIEDMEK